MKIKFNLLICIITLFYDNIYGQNIIFINDASQKYSAKLDVKRCEEGYCGGRGTIEIFEKGSPKQSQVFLSKDFYFPVDDAKLINKEIKLNKEESPLIFDDFNFDGIQDLAIPNGPGGYYMGSFDVYVYNIQKKQFIKNIELTNIASHQGLFQVDHKRKRLISYTKSGCCWHQTAEYQFLPKERLVKVYDLVEDGAKVENIVIVTEQKLLNGKWSKTTKRYKPKEYYKDM